MGIDPNDAAKRVLIAYRQLTSILKESIVHASAKAHLLSYNKILDTMKECFSIDSAFAESVQHLKPLGTDLGGLAHQMESDGKCLIATAHAFIEFYLSAEDKKNAIGFHG
jgi:hypothetical protein